MANVVYAPGNYESHDGPFVFCAGAIDQGSARDWQKEVIEALKDVEGTVLNPRRADWDSTWVQDISNPEFRIQVEWELDGMDMADVVAMCFPAASKAPISLLELGLHAASGKMVVCCEPGYWRKGNVDVVCARNGIPVFEGFGEFLAEVVRRMRASRVASRVAALGTNRDYKTTDRRTRNNLAVHFQRMKELMDKGMSKEEASKQAFDELFRHKKTSGHEEQLEMMRSVRKTMPPPTKVFKDKSRPSRRDEKSKLRKEYWGTTMSEIRTRRGKLAGSLIGPMSAEEVDAEVGPKEGPPAMVQPLRARRDYGASTLVKKASDAMGFLALQMAEEHIDMRWTTAEKDWKVQAKKNLTLAVSKWNAGAERMDYVFKTFARVTEPGYAVSRIDTRITVSVSEESKES